VTSYVRVKETKRPLELVRLLPKGRKKVELFIISTGLTCSHATVPHIVALPGLSFHTAKIDIFPLSSKFFSSEIGKSSFSLMIPALYSASF
jgi:hypothetical protein